MTTLYNAHSSEAARRAELCAPGARRAAAATAREVEQHDAAHASPHEPEFAPRQTSPLLRTMSESRFPER